MSTHKCSNLANAASSMVVQWSRIRLPMQEAQEMQVPSLGREDPLEEEVVTHSSILAWRIQWTEEAGGLSSMGSQSRIWIHN